MTTADEISGVVLISRYKALQEALRNKNQEQQANKAEAIAIELNNADIQSTLDNLRNTGADKRVVKATNKMANAVRALDSTKNIISIVASAIGLGNAIITGNLTMISRSASDLLEKTENV